MSELIVSPLDPAEFAAGVEVDDAVGVTTDGRVAFLAAFVGERSGARTWIVFTPDEARRCGRLLIEGADRAEGA